jgi:hypothetical protein
MAVVVGVGGGGLPDFITLSAGETGNGQSVNSVDRGGGLEAALLTIDTTVGATPTVSLTVEGSADGADWWPVPYADVASPTVVAVASLTITTAGRRRLILQPDVPWRYLRVTRAANTNVTVTANVAIF